MGGTVLLTSVRAEIIPLIGANLAKQQGADAKGSEQNTQLSVGDAAKASLVRSVLSGMTECASTVTPMTVIRTIHTGSVKSQCPPLHTFTTHWLAQRLTETSPQ